METQQVGNETTPTEITYTHDMWNRLVQVNYPPVRDAENIRAQYGYNGLNWRVFKRADTDASAGSGSLDQQRLMYYSANWQLLEERIDVESTFPTGQGAGTHADIDKHVQYIWGPRYIDDIVVHRLDANKDGDFIDSGDAIYYHCTDSMFSTVAVLTPAAVVLERVSYDAYGNGRNHKRADCAIGEGGVDSDDLTAVNTSWGGNPAKGDVTRDGQVNIDDLVAVNTTWGSGLALGKISSSSTSDNQIGWDGYVFNQELNDDGMYTVRHRHYRPGLGRWVERDPLGTLVLNLTAEILAESGDEDFDELDVEDEDNWADMLSRLSWDPQSQYDDGFNLHQYGTSRPLNGVDPAGGAWWLWPFKKQIQRYVLTPVGGAIGRVIGKGLGKLYAKQQAKQIAKSQKKRLALAKKLRDKAQALERRRAIVVGAFDRLDDHAKGQAKCLKFLRIEDHLILAHESADRCDF